MSDKRHASTPTKGKQGVNIDANKYQVIHDAIIAILNKHPEYPFKTLPAAVAKELREPFEGSVSWYTTTVKLDMETQGIIERIPGMKPQHIRLIPDENTGQ